MVELTEAEAAVYDRQLRVWGIEVQKRYRLYPNLLDCWHPSRGTQWPDQRVRTMQVERSENTHSRLHRLGSRGKLVLSLASTGIQCLRIARTAV